MDSAAGSAKNARNEQIDAIFPAFGKINNTYDYSLDKILVSSKILDVVKILECGIGEDFDIETEFELYALKNETACDTVG